MRTWQQKLPESQRNVLNEIVEQIPETMGVRAAIENILDNLAGGDTSRKMSGDDVYDVYAKAMADQGVSVDDFDDLEEHDQSAWGAVADLMSAPKFRFVIASEGAGDVQGTNDEDVARECATDEANYVIDVVNNKWITTEDESDDSDISELRP